MKNIPVAFSSFIFSMLFLCWSLVTPILHCPHYFLLVPKTFLVLSVIFLAYQLPSMASEHISVAGRRIIWFNEIWVTSWLRESAHIYFSRGKLSAFPRILMLVLLWLIAGYKEVSNGRKVLLHTGLSALFPLFVCLSFVLRTSLTLQPMLART